jgi:GT2 family glycosyltransferase
MSIIDGISVIIPNYNGSTLLPQAIPPVMTALQQTGLSYEIIVADDCSTDDSVKMLIEQFPGVKCIRNEKNSGFSVTANKGIRTAKYSWVLLLNSDVKLEPGYFQPLFKYTGRAGVFGIMGRIIGWEDEIVQDGAKYPFFHGVKFKTSGNYLLSDESKMQDGLYSMYISGANAFLNREIFLKIGGFNEIFSPYYAEDTELSFRAWRLGYTCLFDYNAVCRHKTSFTIKSTAKKKHVDIIYNRNKMYLHAIHLDFPNNFLWFLQLVFEVVSKTLLLKFNYTQSFFLFIKNYGKVRKSRVILRQLTGDKKLISVKVFFKKIIDSIKNETIKRF